MTPDAQIQALSRSLGLEDCRQDWGITNADPARIEEFLDRCEATQLTLAQQPVMGELVLASLNEALLDGADPEGVVVCVERLLASGLHGLTAQVNYWSSLEGGGEFPIGPLLQRLATRVCGSGHD